MHWTGKVKPVAFSIGSVNVAWYGLIITCAMIIALLICIKRMKRFNVSSDDMLMLFLFAIPSAIIFARLGYVISNYEYYFVSPYDWDAFVNTIAIWHGGLTIMWGVPGGVLGGFIWSKIYKKSFINAVDVVLPTVLIAQAMGRWGNFFNQELYGQLITNPAHQWFPLAVYIAREGAFFQATFFYESVLNTIGFIVLGILWKRIDLKGFGLCSYFIWYFTVRGSLEFLRSETSGIDQVTSINTVMLFCYIAAAIFAGILTFLFIRKHKKGGRIFYKNGVPPLPIEKKDIQPELEIKN